MARYYANENIALQFVVELRRLGGDVVTSLEAGNANASIPDKDVLAFAASQDRILLSHNRRHFLRLHRRWTAIHSGIVLCSVDPDFSGQAQRINRAVAEAGDMKNRVVRVNRPA